MVNKIIDKSKFYNEKKIDKDSIAIFKKYVNNIYIRYTLKSEILNIKKIRKNFQEYNEIEVIEVNINDHRAVYDIAKTIGSNIPYPLIIIFIYGCKLKIGSYCVRENVLSNYRNVVENITVSGWFNIKDIFGRLKNIINETNFNKMHKENMYELFNAYYSVIKKYQANYVSIDDVINIIIKQIKNPPSHRKKFILNNCMHIRVNKNIYKKVDILKTNKLNKYNNTIENEKIMIDNDELYRMVVEKLHMKFRDYDDFNRKIMFLKRENEVDRTIQKKKDKWDCCFFDGEICINLRCNNYEKDCFNADNCKYFKRENKKNIYNKNDIEWMKLDNKEKLYNNKIIDIVEVGDKVEILDIISNQKKVYAVKNNIKGILPGIPKLCINRKVGYKFIYEKREYEILNIIKNNSLLENKIELCKM